MGRSRKHWNETHEERTAREYLEQFPLYPNIPGAAKFRKIANPTREQRIAHATVIENTIRALQVKELARELPEIKPACASGTFINNGAELHEHLVRQRRAALARVPDQERAKRTDRELIAQYEAHMAAQRTRQAAEQEAA